MADYPSCFCCSCSLCRRHIWGPWYLMRVLVLSINPMVQLNMVTPSRLKMSVMLLPYTYLEP